MYVEQPGSTEDSPKNYNAHSIELVRKYNVIDNISQAIDRTSSQVKSKLPFLIVSAVH